jgi:hypothetical protein
LLKQPDNQKLPKWTKTSLETIQTSGQGVKVLKLCGHSSGKARMARLKTIEEANDEDRKVHLVRGRVNSRLPVRPGD